MNLNEFKQALSQNPEQELLFRLPSGTTLVEHFHVTEVGRVTKDFIDCGGTRRKTESCMLQTLVADDVDHRFTAGKLAKILDMAEVLGLAPETPVEAEIQNETINIFSMAKFTIDGKKIVFDLNSKQTECLAPDTCNLPPAMSLPVADSGNC